MEKGGEVDELKKQPSQPSSKWKADPLPVAQAFLKIISAQIEVKENETKFVKQIQDSELVVQVKYSLGFKTKPAAGSLIPQFHAGFTFAVYDLNTKIKIKLISTKRLINTTLGKVVVPLDTMLEDATLVEMPISLENLNKKLKSVKLSMILKCVRDDAMEFARRYSVLSHVRKLKRFKHVNGGYFTQKGIVTMHPSFKIVLERANYFPGEVVRGAVIYDLTKTVDHISYLKISAMGTETSTWTEGSGSSEVTYTDSRIKFSLLQYAISAPNTDGVSMFAGMHVYPFQVQLPSTLPTSINCDGANMTYFVLAEVASVKNRRVKSASAYFNVYGADSKFQPPMVITDPPRSVSKHLIDNWCGEVTLSSQLQLPHKPYGMTIKFHNVKRAVVKRIKVSIKCVKHLIITNKVRPTRSHFWMWHDVKRELPFKETDEEHIQIDYQYSMPGYPPTVTQLDGIELFQFHTFAKISLTLADSTKYYRVVPITVGKTIPEHVAREPHEINPDVSRATMTIYQAKRPLVHGLMAFKSTSIQFFDEKIFAYNPADLIVLENWTVEQVATADSKLVVTNNNNNEVEEDEKPVRNKYVDIDEDELPDSDESKSM